MTLIVDPGSAEARAYASVEELQAYASDYGHSLIDGEGNAYSESALEQALRQGAILLAGYAPRFPGQRASSSQRMDWPRSNAKYRDGSAIASDDIPAIVKDANCEAALRALSNPDDIRSVISGLRVKKQEAGPVSIEYFDSDEATDLRATLTAVEDLLAALLLDENPQTAAKKRPAFLVAGSDGT